MAKTPAKKPAIKTEQNVPAQTVRMEPSQAIYSMPLEYIIFPQRLRQVDDDVAIGIADSMAVNGQQTPIEVSSPNAEGKYTLITGAHRLRAAQINEWTEINAVIFSGSPTQCRLREIDENLIRRELSPLDRAVFLAERKKIYEELYPETKAGAAGANARWHTTAKFAFASETAERCGLSERSIQLAIQRYSRIAPDVREEIALTWLAHKGTELDALAKLEPDEQRKAVGMILSGEEAAPKSVNEASKIIRGVREKTSNDDEMDADFEAFTRKWTKNAYSARTKRNIVAWLEAEGHFGGAADGEELAEVA